MGPTSDYFRKKLKVKYGNHPNVRNRHIDRISKILCSIDERIEGISFSYNINYIKIERLNPNYREDDKGICNIDFTNQEPRVFYNLSPKEFETSFDVSRKMRTLNYANFGGGNSAKPYYTFDNHDINSVATKRDEYFIDTFIAVCSYLTDQDIEKLND